MRGPAPAGRNTGCRRWWERLRTHGDGRLAPSKEPADLNRSGFTLCELSRLEVPAGTSGRGAMGKLN